MSLKLFTRKKKAVQKHEEKEQQKELLDVMKMNALDKMVSLLEELNVNIGTNVNTTEIITTTSTKQPQINQETKSKPKQQENTFIPSIDTSNISSKNITSVKKKTKKRKISDTVDKLNSKTKKK